MHFPNLYEEFFYKALQIRLVEEKVIELYPSDKIQSPIHLSIGQEAVAVGVCQSMRVSDMLFCSYRSHAFYLAKGGDLLAMMAELYGKVTGCGEGKAGSMHLAAPEVGLMGSSAIVASTIPHAVGAALAAKRLNKKDQVIIVAYGDGATDEGVYHESLNFASLHELPVIFLCENNGFAVHSRVKDRQSFMAEDHAKVYGLPTTKISDGHDMLKIHQEFSNIIDQVRDQHKPQYVEIETYRYRQHVGPGEDFEAGYRSKNELEQWRSKDALLLDQDLYTKYEPMIREEIDSAIEFAEKSPWPGEEHLLKDVI